MVGITRNVAADGTVDGPAPVQFEQVLVLDRIFFLDAAVEQRAEIFDDPRALADFSGGEQAEPGAGAADAIGFSRRGGRHDTLKNGTGAQALLMHRSSSAIPGK